MINRYARPIILLPCAAGAAVCYFCFTWGR